MEGEEKGSGKIEKTFNTPQFTEDSLKESESSHDSIQEIFIPDKNSSQKAEYFKLRSRN